MKEIWQFIVAHHTAITLSVAWLFSAFCSTMPALPQDAGYFTKWAHDFLQTAAANVGKVGQRTENPTK